MIKRLMTLAISSTITAILMVLFFRKEGITSLGGFVSRMNREAVILIAVVFLIIYILARLLTELRSVIFSCLFGIILYQIVVLGILYVLLIPAFMVERNYTSLEDRNFYGLIAVIISFSIYMLIDFVVGIIKDKIRIRNTTY